MRTKENRSAMIKRFPKCLILFFVASMANAAKPSDVPVSVCELFAHAAKFDGQLVQVEGVAVESIHTAAFIAPECSVHSGNDAAQLTFVHLRKEDSVLLDEYWAKLRTDRSIKVEVRGVFRAGDRQYGPGGFPYEIDVSAIVRIGTLSKKYAKQHGLPR